MSLTRKGLSAMGIEADKIDEIINGHTDTVNGLKETIDELNVKLADAEKISKENDDLKKQLKEYEGGEDMDKKYSDLKKEYDDYKKSIEDEKTLNEKKTAVKELLKELGVSEKRHEAILKVTDLDNINLDKEGKINDVDKLKDSLKTEWSDFIETTRQEGVDTETPPDNNGGTESKKSRAAILAAEYQKNKYGNEIPKEGN